MRPRYLTAPHVARHHQKKTVEEEGIAKRLWLLCRSGRPDSLPPGHAVDKRFHCFVQDHFVEIESW
jgi:hypothetical protein